MDNNKAEKKMYKKIERLLKSIAHDGNCEKIIKKFGSINYQYNGDSLYHLITKKNTVFVNQVINIIYFLMDAGLDINIRNNEGKTFLQTSDMKSYMFFINALPLKDMDLNNQDNKGKTILHNLVDECISIDQLRMIYNEFRDNMDLTLKDNEGKTYLDKIERNCDIADYQYVNVTKILKEDYYYRNLNYFIDEINDSNNFDSLLNTIFVHMDRRYLTYWCQDNEHASEDEKIKAMKKLSDLNSFDPNFHAGTRHTIVIEAINKGYSEKYILELSKLCLNYDYKVNNSPTIMKCFFNKTYSFKTLLNIYVLLSQYGYKNLINDIYLSKIENKDEIYKKIRSAGLERLLNDLLLEKKLVASDIKLSDDLLEFIFEVKKIVEDSLEFQNDYGLAKLLVQKIIQNRENNINIVEENVRIKELTDTLKMILDEHISNVVSSTTKILNKYSQCY